LAEALLSQIPVRDESASKIKRMDLDSDLIGGDAYESHMTAKPRPGGRSARNKAAIFEATAALLAERGHDAVTMTDIAERAGVAATSLYRRWGDVRALVMEVAVEQLTRERPLPDTGSLRGDLRAWARPIATSLASREGSSFFRAVIATTTPAGADGSLRSAALKRRGEQMALMLERARQRGEKPPDVAEVMDHVLAPLYMRVLFGMPINKAVADRLIERLIG
jgi:AcrR family transcriptional regulator